MHTVELLEEACGVAESLGYKIRQEWLGGTGGGACEFAGRKWIFIDLALNAIEQLDQVATALRNDPSIYFASMSSPLQQLLEIHVEPRILTRESGQRGTESHEADSERHESNGGHDARRVA
ncbi:MAG: hypothetical protein ACQESR_24595 [Planctomycetota bacterium]